MSKLKGYLLVGVGGIVLLAMLLLVFLQWGNVASLSLYGKNLQVNTGLLMVCSGAGGVVAVAMVWLLIAGIRCLRKARPAAPGGPAPR